MATLKPEQDYVLVEEENDTEQTEGGIFLPQSASGEGIKFGSVRAVGPGRYENGQLIEVDFEPGQKVVWKDISEIEFRFEGSRHTMVPADSIVATVEQ